MTGIVSSTGRQFVVIADSARGPSVGIVNLSRKAPRPPETVEIAGVVYVRRRYERSAGGLAVYVRLSASTG